MILLDPLRQLIYCQMTLERSFDQIVGLYKQALAICLKGQNHQVLIEIARELRLFAFEQKHPDGKVMLFADKIICEHRPQDPHAFFSLANSMVLVGASP